MIELLTIDFTIRQMQMENLGAEENEGHKIDKIKALKMGFEYFLN